MNEDNINNNNNLINQQNNQDINNNNNNNNDNESINNNYFCNNSNINYLNLFVLLFLIILLIIDLYEWKKLFIAWHFSLNNSKYLFELCHESDLDFRSVSLIFSTFTDILIFYFFLILTISNIENACKLIKLGYRVCYFVYGPLLFIVCILALFNSESYMYICDKDKLISYYMYFGTMDKDNISKDLINIENTVSNNFSLLDNYYDNYIKLNNLKSYHNSSKLVLLDNSKNTKKKFRVNKEYSENNFKLNVLSYKKNKDNNFIYDLDNNTFNEILNVKSLAHNRYYNLNNNNNNIDFNIKKLREEYLNKILNKQYTYYSTKYIRALNSYFFNRLNYFDSFTYNKDEDNLITSNLSNVKLNQLKSAVKLYKNYILENNFKNISFKKGRLKENFNKKLIKRNYNNEIINNLSNYIYNKFYNDDINSILNKTIYKNEYSDNINTYNNIYKNDSSIFNNINNYYYDNANYSNITMHDNMDFYLNSLITKEEYEHIIVNTKLFCGLCATNVFVGILISTITIIVFGIYYIVSLYINSYLLNNKGSYYLSKLFWYMVFKNKDIDKSSLIRKASLIQQDNNAWYNNSNISGFLNNHTNRVFVIMTDYLNTNNEIEANRSNNNSNNNIV